jgi:nucleoside-diphosphate-sugar epimerase
MRVLVAGASGLVGAAAAARFADDGIPVIGLARTLPARPVPGAVYHRLDLRDRAACQQVAAGFGAVTHVVYAAVNETPGDLVASWTDPDHAARNGSMFANLLDALIEAGAPLAHVALVHGTKAYGVHLGGQIPVPLRESLPRPGHDDFYFRQQDHLGARAAERGFVWTVLRAPMIAGGGRGGNLNALLAIAVYAALCCDAGRDLPFPGAAVADGVMEMVDVELLARGLAWAATAPAARNEVFNIANGDTYCWPDLWPIIAADHGLAVGPPQPISLRAAVAAEAGRWAAIVRANGLEAPADIGVMLGESAALADFALGNCRQSVLTSTIRIRQAGFHDCIDTAQSVLGWMQRWRDDRLLPPVPRCTA